MTPTGSGRAVLSETGDFVTGEEAESRELGAEQSEFVSDGVTGVRGGERGAGNQKLETRKWKLEISRIKRPEDGPGPNQ